MKPFLRESQRVLRLFTFADVIGDRQMLRAAGDGILKRHGMGFQPPAGSLEALNFKLKRSRRAPDHVVMHTHEGIAMLGTHQVEYRTAHRLLLAAGFNQFQAGGIHVQQRSVGGHAFDAARSGVQHKG